MGSHELSPDLQERLKEALGSYEELLLGRSFRPQQCSPLLDGLTAGAAHRRTRQ